MTELPTSSSWIRILFISLVASAALRGESRFTVEAENPEDFTDFVLHGQSAEDTWTIFQREAERYWEQRLSEYVPEGMHLHIVFIDIDMAGKEEPARNPGLPDLRYYENQFIPRLHFAYRFSESDAEPVAEGVTEFADPNFDFRGSGRMTSQQYAFGYELEMLRRWIREVQPWREVTED